MKRVESEVHGRLLAPVVVIEIILTAPLFIWGVYTLTPLYHEQVFDDAWSNTFVTFPIFVAAAVGYTIIGGVSLFGILFGKCRVTYYGMAATFAAYMYLALAKALNSGPHRPAYWMFYFALALVAAVCYLRERTNGDE